MKNFLVIYYYKIFFIFYLASHRPWSLHLPISFWTGFFQHFCSKENSIIIDLSPTYLTAFTAAISLSLLYYGAEFNDSFFQSNIFNLNFLSFYLETISVFPKIICKNLDKRTIDHFTSFSKKIHQNNTNESSIDNSDNDENNDEEDSFIFPSPLPSSHNSPSSTKNKSTKKIGLNINDFFLNEAEENDIYDHEENSFQTSIKKVIIFILIF